MIDSVSRNVMFQIETGMGCGVAGVFGFFGVHGDRGRLKHFLESFGVG